MTTIITTESQPAEAIVAAADTGIVDLVQSWMFDPLPGVVSAPQLLVTWAPDGTSAEIRNVRYLHKLRCLHCGNVTQLYTDGGTYTVGLLFGDDESVRWLSSDLVGVEEIAAPATCPHAGCGKPGGFGPARGSYFVGRQIIALAHAVQDEIRGRFPALAAVADANPALTVFVEPITPRVVAARSAVETV